MDNAITAAMATLDVAIDASPEDVRGAYLNLVRQYPPDRDAEKFRQIHAAYQLLSDPIVQAESMLAPPSDHPDLHALIAAAEREPARLPKLVLLALGNQPNN